MRNNRNISLIISVLFILFGNLCCFAQKDVTFKLSRADSGHYMFPVMLNSEVKASALLESGIHAMLLDSAFAFENHEKLGVEFLPCDEKMNLGGRKYRITHKQMPHCNWVTECVTKERCFCFQALPVSTKLLCRYRTCIMPMGVASSNWTLRANVCNCFVSITLPEKSGAR